MSKFRVWSSILGWAAFAVLAAWSTQEVLLWYKPGVSYGTVLIAVFLAVQVAYGVRQIARRLGWARRSYAPTGIEHR